MSIFPAADLVSGVAQAADPRKLAGAMKRLAETSDSPAPPGVQFASALKSAAGEPAPGRAHSGVAGGAPPSRTFASASASPPLRAAGADGAASEAARKFEAFVIQSFLEIVLPKEDEGAYGQGAAGGVWRSMMAEQLGTQIAKAGGVGLQKMLDSHLARRHAEHAPTSVS